ncbi:family metal ion transporter [Fusarium albosuccineum]|uniref:Family metal ion transporter n=1 Tax=Fusarium albosuccineum TaxID=1237068 RepID=A0A8H4P5G6_9HYPO|nr:family metal ion transporter [Fusarium albosuccineum]
MESVVPSAEYISMRSSSTIDAVEEALQQCKAEIGEAQPNATFDLGSCTEDQKWLIMKADEAVRALRADLGQSAARYNNSAATDEPWFSVRIISLKDGGEPLKRAMRIRAPGDINWLKHQLELFGYSYFSPYEKQYTNMALERVAETYGMSVRAKNYIICSTSSLLVPDDRDLHQHIKSIQARGDWHSATVPSTARPSSSPASTKVLRFPGPLPPFETKYYWMERHKIHGGRPQSTSNVAIWGDWRRDSEGGVHSNDWSCLMAFSDHDAATTYSEQLASLLSAGETQKRQEMANHWSPGCYYVYLLGLNDAKLRAMQAAEVIDGLRYQSATDPSIGAALACLMLMNHLEHHKRLLEFIRVRLDKVPEAWEIVKKPDWTRAIDKKCRSAIKGIDKVHKEANRVRSLVIEQYGISRSRSLGFLSILAAFFIPITAVSGFFGMNTTEINGSSWPTKYFGIIAGPLTIISVLLPLVALDVLDYFLRFLSSSFVLPLVCNILLLMALVIDIWFCITPIDENPTAQGTLFSCYAYACESRGTGNLESILF